MAGLWDAVPALALELRASGGDDDDWLGVTDRVMWKDGGVTYERGRNPGTLRYSPGQFTAVLDNRDGSLSPGSTTALGKILNGDFEVRFRCNPPAGLGSFNMVRDGSFEDSDVTPPFAAYTSTSVAPTPFASLTSWGDFWGGGRWTLSVSSGDLVLDQVSDGSGYLQHSDASVFAVLPGDVVTVTMTATTAGNAVKFGPGLYLSTSATPANCGPFNSSAVVYNPGFGGSAAMVTPKAGVQGTYTWQATVPNQITPGAGTGTPLYGRVGIWAYNTTGVFDGLITFDAIDITVQREITTSHSTTRASLGSQSLKVELPSSSSLPVKLDMADLDLLPGVSYEVRAKVYNPSTLGAATVRLTDNVDVGTGGQATSTKDQWVSLAHTFTPTGRPRLGLRVEGPWSAGAAVWVDEVSVRPAGGGYAGYATPVFSTTARVVNLWKGDGFSRRYAGNHLQPVVTITNVDNLARLDGLTVPSTPLGQELRLLDPDHYWPLLTSGRDVAREKTGVDRRDFKLQKRGTPADTAFAWGGGSPVGVGGPAGVWLDGTTTNNRFLSTTVRLPSGYTTRQEYVDNANDPSEANLVQGPPAFLLFFNVPEDETYASGDPPFLVEIEAGSSTFRVLFDDLDGTIVADEIVSTVDVFGDPVVAENYTAYFDVDVRDGKWHSVLLVHDADRFTVSLDGGANGVDSWTTAHQGWKSGDTATGAFKPWGKITLGDNAFTGTLAHAAAWFYAPEDLEGTVEGLLALARWDLPEPTMTALERVGRWTGIGSSDPAADLYDTGPLWTDPNVQVFAHVQWSGEAGQKISDLVSRIEATEGGHVYADGRGRLAMQSGYWAVDRNTSNKVTLSFADIDGMPTVTFDDRMAADVGDQIDVTAPVLPEPISVRFRTPAKYSQTVDTLAPTVSDAINIASWRSHLGVPPRPAWDEITVNLLALQRWGTTSPLFLDVGTWVAFTGVPSQYSALPTDLTVTGVKVQITLTEWKVVFTGLDRGLFDCLVVGADTIGSSRVLAPSRGTPGDLRAMPGGDPVINYPPNPGTGTPPKSEDDPGDHPAPDPDPDSGSGQTVLKVTACGDCTIDGGNYRKVVKQIEAINPDKVFLLGDLVQRQSNWSRWKEWFIPTYGQFKAKMWSIPGNHCYRQPNARSYRKYFGIAAGASLNWNAVSNGWLIIGLDSQKPNAALTYLNTQLATNRSGSKQPVVVAWHKPRFVYTSGPPDSPELKGLWNAFHDDPHTRILLHGHDHDWAHRVVERNGRKRDVFVVGTGGGEVRMRGGRNMAPSGVLQLNLRSDGGYRWWYRDALQRKSDPKGKVLHAGRRYL